MLYGDAMHVESGLANAQERLALSSLENPSNVLGGYGGADFFFGPVQFSTIYFFEENVQRRLFQVLLLQIGKDRDGKITGYKRHRLVVDIAQAAQEKYRFIGIQTQRLSDIRVGRLPFQAQHLG